MRAAKFPFWLQPWGDDITRLAALVHTEPVMDAAHQVLVLQLSPQRRRSPGVLFEVEFYRWHGQPRLCLNFVASVSASDASFQATGLHPITTAQMRKALRLAQLPVRCWKPKYSLGRLSREISLG